MTRFKTTLLASLATLLALSTPVAAQQMRSLHVSRALADTSPLHVNLQYGVGTLTVKPATTPVLYDARLSYLGGRSAPLATFDVASRTLDIGIRDHHFEGPGSDSGGALHVQLAPGVPLDLSLKFGATEATLNLGGLAVRQLTLKGGATETTLRFDTPNTIPMESLTLKVGAAELHGHGLANARAKQVFVEGAAGEIDLWFDGTWTSDVMLDSKILFGDMRIHVPPNVQVVSTAKAMLGSVDDNATGKPSKVKVMVDTDDSSDMNDASDSSDMDDSDSSDSSDMSALSPGVKAQIAAAKAQAASVKAQVAAAKAQAAAAKAGRGNPQPHPEPHPEPHPGQATGTGPTTTYTLRITGSATIGSLEILHDATPTDTPSH